MSVLVLSQVWRHYPNGGGEMLTALALADIADDRGNCVYDDTAAARIGDKTLQSERAVRYHFKTMQQIGWLQVTANATGGRGRKLEYRIPVELIPMGAAGRVQKLPGLLDRQTVLDDQPQDVVSEAGQSLQKLPALKVPVVKVANGDTKVAKHDAKGGKTQHPSNIGYVVHKTTYPVTPENFPLTQDIRGWAKAEGLAHPSLDAHHAYFIDYVNNKSGKPYKDLQGAFRNCVRSDWGNIRRNWKGGFTPAKTETLTCQANSAGQPCGMPAKNHGGVIECEGCYTKRVSMRGMPADVRAKLGLTT